METRRKDAEVGLGLGGCLSGRPPTVLRIPRAWATALFPFEISNVLLMAERRKRVTEAELLQAKADLAALPIAIEGPPTAAVLTDIMQLARLHGLSYYDASYLELAIRLNARLGSFDEALRKAATAAGISVCP